MAYQEHLDLLKLGVKHWNLWSREHQDVQPDLSGANLSGVDLNGFDLSGVNLSKANLSRANLSGADLNAANLSKANLSEAYLSEANFSGAILGSANLYAANLSAADLSRTKLSTAYLSEANLNRAKLSEANLSAADLSRTKLSEANLSRVRLIGANLRRAILNRAKLSEANLSAADFSRAILSEADFSMAILSGTVFAENDLSTVKGLVEINHRGPSRVELYTVQLPQDGSAFHFLRGTGVPNEWIDFYRSSMMMPIQYHSCFISYSSEDDVLARRLHADLQDQGVRCWFAPEDMKIGDKIRARIDEAIHLQDKLLLLLSEHAIASIWVEDEVEAAFEKEEKRQREVLFPVRLDEQVMQTKQPWAAKLRRTRHIGDFTRWTDPHAYQQAFERLLRDLKSETTQNET